MHTSTKAWLWQVSISTAAAAAKTNWQAYTKVKQITVLIMPQITLGTRPSYTPNQSRHIPVIMKPRHLFVQQQCNTVSISLLMVCLSCKQNLFLQGLMHKLLKPRPYACERVSAFGKTQARSFDQMRRSARCAGRNRQEGAACQCGLWGYPDSHTVEGSCWYPRHQSARLACSNAAQTGQYSCSLIVFFRFLSCYCFGVGSMLCPVMHDAVVLAVGSMIQCWLLHCLMLSDLWTGTLFAWCICCM